MEMDCGGPNPRSNLGWSMKAAGIEQDLNAQSFWILSFFHLSLWQRLTLSSSVITYIINIKHQSRWRAERRKGGKWWTFVVCAVYSVATINLSASNAQKMCIGGNSVNLDWKSNGCTLVQNHRCQLGYFDMLGRWSVKSKNHREVKGILPKT